MNEVWIKLHGKFKYWEWYKNKNTKIMFIHCLLKANWKDSFFEGIAIKRGSFATSLKTLCNELGMTIQECRTAIKHLISTREITQSTYPKFIVITVNNYDLYQASNTMINMPATHEQQQYKNIDIITNTYLNKIEKNFGRTLAPLEMEMIKDWVNEIDDFRKIDYAIKETVTNGVRNLRYTNKIIKTIKNENFENLVNKTENKESEETIDIPEYDWLNDE